MDSVMAIRSVLADYRDGGEAVVSGGWAINADIRDTMNRDLLRAIGFVLLGIFIVLLIMLRSAVAPLYLIATVLLSFTFTLGLTNVVMRAWLDVEGLTWYVPFFIFVMLVGLGVDYSIFLIGRVKEEVGNHGIREGVHIAVAATGAIITSAGVILAGTFAAMTAGEIKGLIELGFAVAVGILIDTFVVRTMLVPAITILLDRWAWWPGGVPKARPRRAAQEDALGAGD
jgi:RND superfamily putative drug exporter